MKTEHRHFELWRECNWSCEWWTVGGRPEVRLYFNGHQVGDLADGPQLDLRRQTDEWLMAVRAESGSRRGQPKPSHAAAVAVVAGGRGYSAVD